MQKSKTRDRTQVNRKITKKQKNIRYYRALDPRVGPWI